ATSVVWRFGDGYTSTVLNPSHTYNLVGTYTVYHIAINECGRDSTARAITVTNPGKPPIADFVYDWDPFCDSARAYFNDASIGHITSWSWTFGDGGTSSLQHPWHTYHNPGTYSVRLIVSGPEGADTAQKSITVWFQPDPISGFIADPTVGAAPLTVQFTSTSSYAVMNLWRFGDGDSTTGSNPSHTYQTAGTYTAYQVAINGCGRDSTSVKIRVGQDIYADFTGNSPVCVDSLVQFTDLSYGVITDWAWNFGDGHVDSAQNPGHSYDAPGSYTISLTVTGPAGSDTETKINYITVNGGPAAAFDADPTYGLRPLTVSFVNQSLDADSVLWDFDDGATSSLNNPSHTFVDTGHYDVTLTAFNECGSNQTSRTIIVDIPTGELTIFKQVSSAVAEGEDILTYYVAVRNTGDETEGNVVVRDTVPNLTTFLGGTILVDAGSCAYDAASNSLTWLVDSIVIGAEVHLEFDVQVDSDAPDAAVILNRARITGPEPYGYAEATTVVQAPDIELTKIARPSVANLGDTITYIVRAVNHGAGAVYDTRLIDDLPDEFIYIAGSARLNDTTVTVTGSDPLNFTVGDIAINDSAVITYQVEISLAADTGATYINAATLYENGGGTRSTPVHISTAGHSWGPVHAAVTLTTPPLTITKTASQPSGMTGDMIRYTIEVVNTTDVMAYNARILDTLPAGFVYIPATSLINGIVVPEPFGANPYEWPLGELEPGEKATLTYSVQISTRAAPDINDNIAWAHADQFRPSRATARVNVLSGAYPGSIRGILVVDCDGDGVPEIDSTPSGIDIYLDDGSCSRVNKSGMFYFSTVRAGSHIVKIDTRDLDGYYLPEDQPDAVFCHVHEMGESYIRFRLCLEQPILTIKKQAAVLPKARVTKTGVIDTTLITDSTGVTIDYEIKVETNGNTDPSLIKVIDSLPGETHLILDEQQQLVPTGDGRQLQYEVTVGQQVFEQKVRYSLEDLAPGMRRFLNNKIHLEGGLTADTVTQAPPVSTPAEVAVGPFLLSPPQTLKLNIVGAYFTTALADLRPEAIPVLEELADSIKKYDGAEIKLEGHCDYRRIHTKKFPSNWELSFARAKSVADWLIQESGIDSTILSYEGFAATRPVDTGHTTEALQRNRRVEVFITGKKGPVVDFKAITVNEWKGTTVLELSPTNWQDSLVSGDDGVIDIGLNDSWEIYLKVENTGRMNAERAVLTDILPAGAEFFEGTARIDGVSSPATTGPGNSLNLEIGPLASGQSLDIRYRIRAISETMPAGGGAATAKVTAPESDRLHISNKVIFK
ncbi:MAG: PKD domain-containing protein, partial [Candidatus Zixiibacteriota bacterium]